MRKYLKPVKRLLDAIHIADAARIVWDWFIENPITRGFAVSSLVAYSTYSKELVLGFLHTYWDHLIFLAIIIICLVMEARHRRLKKAKLAEAEAKKAEAQAKAEAEARETQRTQQAEKAKESHLFLESVNKLIEQFQDDDYPDLLTDGITDIKQRCIRHEIEFPVGDDPSDGVWRKFVVGLKPHLQSGDIKGCKEVLVSVETPF